MDVASQNAAQFVYLSAGKSFRGWLLQSPMKLYIDSMQYFGVLLLKIYQLV